MTRMQQHFIRVNNQEIHVRTWNLDAPNTVFCWHGLTHTSADFIALGELLSQQGYRVIAPDALGCGLSQWSRDPANEYNMNNYTQTAIQLLEHFACQNVHWVGCDMGGIIGMMLASDPAYQHLFSSLTLNDIGPEVPVEAANKILENAQQSHCLTQFQDFKQFLQKEYFPVCKNEKIWQQVCEASARRLSVGGFARHYDSKICLKHKNNTINLWNRFSKLTLPIMAMQGTKSQILTKPILTKMRESQPSLTINYYLGCGHSPSLLVDSYCLDVSNFITINSQPAAHPRSQQAQA